ncbi:hypothetical protein [Micromonospora sp. 067-2]
MLSSSVVLHVVWVILRRRRIAAASSGHPRGAIAIVGHAGKKHVHVS